MKPISFREQNIVIAKDQPEYIPIPALKDARGMVTMCWQFSWWERVQMLFTGKLWHQVMTFNAPLQPIKLSLDKPL